ncbi:MAG: SAP domain-containing protein, partial [Candidatus Poseidoniales archaeon]|nr:SAP domain-containing protein [Candidatus Poseidoniales archaeon]
VGYYTDWTVAELREVLRERHLRISGRKAELITRLEAEDNRQMVCCTNCHKPARNMHIFRTGSAC